MANVVVIEWYQSRHVGLSALPLPPHVSSPREKLVAYLVLGDMTCACVVPSFIICVYAEDVVNVLGVA